MRQYLLHILIALDQLANALLGGSADETLSARAYRTEQQGKWLGRMFRPVIDLLFRSFERDHCRNAYIAEFKKLQLPGSYRGAKQ